MIKNDILQSIGLLSPLQMPIKEKTLEQKYIKFLCCLRAGEDHRSFFFDNWSSQFLWSDFRKIIQRKRLGKLLFGLTSYYWTILCQRWSPKIEVRNFNKDWAILLYYGMDVKKKPWKSPAILGFASKKTLLISTGYALTGSELPLFRDDVCNLVDLYGPYSESQDWGDLEEELLTVCCSRGSFESYICYETKKLKWSDSINSSYGSYLLKLQKNQLHLIKKTFGSLSSEKSLIFLQMVLELLESLSKSWLDLYEADNNFELLLMKFGFPDNMAYFQRVEKEYIKKKRAEFKTEQAEKKRQKEEEMKLKNAPIRSPYDFPRNVRIYQLKEMETASLAKWMSRLPGVNHCSIERYRIAPWNVTGVKIKWMSDDIWHEKKCNPYSYTQKNKRKRPPARLITFFRFLLGDKMPKKPTQTQKAN
jgi:hypothetical protein